VTEVWITCPSLSLASNNYHDLSIGNWWKFYQRYIFGRGRNSRAGSTRPAGRIRPAGRQLDNNGVQGRIQRGAGRPCHPQIVDWVDFLTEKLALLGLFSLPEVFCGPQICQKCIGAQGSPGPRWRKSRRVPGGEHLLPNPYPSRRLWRLDSRASGAQFLCPQCKILATPLLG